MIKTHYKNDVVVFVIFVCVFTVTKEIINYQFGGAEMEKCIIDD